MKLIMTGGGESEKFKEVDNLFTRLLGERPSLLFIPLAGDEDDWDDAKNRILEVFSTISFDRIDTCTDLHDLEWDYLKTFQAIYIDGGNTFQLMSMIRDTHTYELLHKFLNYGGIINGDSAGAIVLGSHLETAHFGDEPDDNDSEIYSYQGLNLLGKWAIHAHYKESENEEIVEFVKEFGFPVIALHEDSSIYINDRMLKVIGPDKINIFTKEVNLPIFPGQKFFLD